MELKSYEISTKVDTSNKDFQEDISIKDSDDILAHKLDVRIEEAKALHEKICRDADDSMGVFRGAIDELSQHNKYKSKTVLSRIFFTVRNLVGMATDNPPYVEMIPDSDNPKSIKRCEAIRQNIDWQFLENDFTGKFAEAMFDTWIKRDSYFHWYWDEKRDDVAFDVVGIEDIMLSPEATSIQDAEYVIYKPYKNRKWWKNNYPKVYKKIKFVKCSGDTKDTDSNERGNSARLIQYWEDDIVIEKVMGKDGKDIILRKTENPFYEYRTPEEQIQQQAEKLQEQMLAEQGLVGKIKEKAKKALGMNQETQMMIQEALESFVPVENYLNSPRKPFVQIPSIKLNGQLYSENITAHAREIFLSMNDKKRAFQDNLRGCNQKIVVDKRIGRDKIAKITDEPNQVIVADFEENPNPLYIAKGGEVPGSFHADIAHDESYIDDLYGHHEISRGSGGANTLGQDKMNHESDRTPIRFQVRNAERAVIELVEGWLQLMRLFYTKTHYARKYGEKKGAFIVELINEDIKEGIKPYIKPGSMISLSKEAKAARAVQMYASGALDPYTMFVDMDMPNPQELSNRLVNWMKFQMISKDDPESIMADMSGGSDPMLQSVEKANQENEAIQMGDQIPPTPPEYVTEDHVKTHFAALSDKNFKLDDEDADTLRAHAEVDKATLARIQASMVQSRRTGEEPQNTKEKPAPKKEQPTQ